MAPQFAVLAIVALVALPSVALATQWTVGDDSGWTNINSNYTEWAEGKRFRVGDTLLFNYPVGKHNVYKLNNGPDFQACNIPLGDPLSSGQDVVALDTPGTKWYICGVGQHCAKFNQKLKLIVWDSAEGPAPTPTPGDKPSGASALVSSGIEILAAAAVALVLVMV